MLCPARAPPPVPRCASRDLAAALYACTKLAIAPDIDAVLCATVMSVVPAFRTFTVRLGAMDTVRVSDESGSAGEAGWPLIRYFTEVASETAPKRLGPPPESVRVMGRAPYFAFWMLS